MKKTQNPQAFPNNGGNSLKDPYKKYEYGGMTLLDYFAGQALIPLLSDDSKNSLIEEARSRGCESPNEIGQILAEACYDIAEDFLKEKEKRNEL